MAVCTSSQDRGQWCIFASIPELVSGFHGVVADNAHALQMELKLRRLQDPDFTPSVPIAELRNSATGVALSMGIFSNARYQIVGGVDRYLFDHSNYLIPYLLTSTVFRTLSAWNGQETRLHMQVRAHFLGSPSALHCCSSA
jgi:hypothetical protein